MSRELRDFKNAVLVRNVLARALKADEHDAMEFPTEDALNTYLKEHPRAKPNNHTVKHPKHDESAKPLGKKKLEDATKQTLAILNNVDQWLEREGDKPSDSLPDHLAHLMSGVRQSVNTMLEGINHLPKGSKERERAKEIVQSIDKAIEAPSEEWGVRWNRPGRKPFLTMNNVRQMHKTLKPLVHELDQMLQGQKTLMGA